MSDNKPEQESEKDKSALTKTEDSKVEKTESKPKESRREARQKRVQRILQIFGFPSSGVGIAATIHFLRTGDFQQAAIAGGLTVGVTVIAIAGKFGKNVISKILDKIEEKLEKQEDNLANWVVDGFESFIVRRFSKFQGKYYQQLIYGCRDYRTQGLKTKGPFTLDLEKVFVPLRVAPESAENISPAMIQSRESIEGLGIWDFLAASKKSNSKYNYNYRTIVIIGAPGTGKTTLLENLTLTYAKNTQRRKHKQAPKLIPILLYLRDIRETITNSPKLSLNELLERQKSITEMEPPNNWFKDKLRSKNCLVMLDGLDEVADETQRRAVSIWVNQQIQNYPHARFILTSRPFGYHSASVEGINTVLEVQPFNLEQMEKFINNWYLQSEIMSRLGQEDVGVRNLATQKAADLIKRIKNISPLAAMALNPLLLTMIATVHCYRGALPEGRVELYGEICDVLLGRRREAKGIGDNIRPNQKKVILQVLALGLMQHKTREFTTKLGISLIEAELDKIATSNLTAAGFLEKIENESGLLIEREKNKYEFAHKSFQEYLAALQIKESNQGNILTTHINDDWWEETIRLYAAGSDATNIIRAALENPSIISLRIAFDCSEESRCEPEVREQLLEKLDAGLESSDKSVGHLQSNREIFQLAAEVKLARRLKGLLRVDENLQIDQSYITRAEYQLYVDEKLNSPERFQSGSAKKPITDISWEDALGFCAWLSTKAVLQNKNNIDTQEVYYYRLPTTAEAESHQAKEYINKLQSWTVGGSISAKQSIRIVRNQISPDYMKLVNYLANEEWEKADQETANMILKFVDREGECELDTDSLAKLPVQELFTIDQLWLVYSGGYFGFGVQTNIWENIQNTKLSQAKKFKRFTKILGWDDREEIRFQLDDAPPGSLPCVWCFLNFSSENNQFRTAFVERFITCDLEITRSQFQFDVLTVNKQGKKIKRERCQAKYFTEYLDLGVNLEMVEIPGGTFIMGAPENEEHSSDSERPQHQVTVPSFLIGKYPVTQAQWKAVAALPEVKRELKAQPSHFKGNNLPVEKIFWNDAVEFCARLSDHTGREYRLPSEAEWEYACRAGTATPFHFGETIAPELANYGGNIQETTPVGQFPPNAFGLYDMHGNVWEWCQDTWHENYHGAPTDGSAYINNDNRYRVLRGGSWYYVPPYCRSATRYWYIPDGMNLLNGFRVVCVVSLRAL